MKILVLTNLYPPELRGGYEILCRQVCEALATRGHRVTVLSGAPGAAGDPAGAAPEAPASPGSPVVHRVLEVEAPFHLDYRRSRWHRRAVARRNEARTLSWIRATAPDVIFVWSQLRLTPGPSRAAEKSGVPTLYTFNDRHPLGFRPGGEARGARRLVGRLLDAGPFRGGTDLGLLRPRTVAISRSLAAELTVGGIPVGDDDVVPQGIPLERFPAKGEPGAIHTPMRLLFAGQLHHDKGVDTVIDAAHRLVEEGHRIALTIAGDGPHGEAFRHRAEAGAAAPVIDFAGRVAHADMGRLYRAHDVLVFASRWSEPMGLSHIEAMASGTVVVSTPNGGSAEVVEDGRTGLHVPAGDGDALAGALRRLSASPALARSLASAALDHVRRHHDLRGYVSRLEERLLDAAGSVDAGAASRRAA